MTVGSAGVNTFSSQVIMNLYNYTPLVAESTKLN